MKPNTPIKFICLVLSLSFLFFKQVMAGFILENAHPNKWEKLFLTTLNTDKICWPELTVFKLPFFTKPCFTKQRCDSTLKLNAPFILGNALNKFQTSVETIFSLATPYCFTCIEIEASQLYRPPRIYSIIVEVSTDSIY